MHGKSDPSPKKEFSYFEAQASWGVTRHMGGLEATDELAALCRIGEGQDILGVGCGTGLTACHLAERYGCRVVGVDTSEAMIGWAARRAQRKKVAHAVQFRTADAQDLPFEGNVFDAVICESVTVFPQDKRRVVNEYVRVAKQGGYVGLNEGTWMKGSPPVELVEYAKRTMAGAVFLLADEWRALLESAGLAHIIVRAYEIHPFSQRLNEMRGLDAQDILDRMRGFKDFIILYARNPEFRRYARGIMPSARIIKNLFTYLGYGLYMGRRE